MSANPTGICQCGCGGTTPRAKTSKPERGYRKGDHLRLIPGHQGRGELHYGWKGGRSATGCGYVSVMVRDGRWANGYAPEHVVIAEKAMGKPLPQGAEVHHINGDRADNRPQNLVVCPDHAYHMLLHRRARAMEECGNANWHRCRICGQWGSEDVLHTFVSRGRHGAYHRECNARVARERNRKQKMDSGTLVRK